jgi:signal transduction histidine kinase
MDTAESDPEKLRERFEDFLRHWCQTDLAELLVANGGAYTGRSLALANQGFVALCRQGWVTPEHLQRLPPDPAVVESLGLMSSQGLAAVLAVPRGSDCPSLLVALGPKHSLRPYTYPDIMLLLNLAELLDNILSHARLSAHAAKIARMESFAMMSRGLAHDLNNLTTPVSTFLLHCEDRVEPGTAEAAVLADAKHSIKVMQDYIRESMFFSRRLVPQFTPVSTSEILSSAIKSTHDRARHHGVEVRIWADERIPFQADPALVQRLVQNLVFNGIDASGRGDVVELSAVAFDAHHVCLKVTDHGAGIPPATMDHIFEPYFTTKDTGDDIRGLGLGLAICRKIVDLHGGRIEVRTNPGAGTTFAVILPVTPVSQPQSASPGTKPAAARRLFVLQTANTAGSGN